MINAILLVFAGSLALSFLVNVMLSLSWRLVYAVKSGVRK